MTIGTVDPSLVECVAGTLKSTHCFEVTVCRSEAYPLYAFEPRRNQYFSKKILARLAAEIPAECDKIVAVTEVDLCTPVLSFVFGEAQLSGRSAIVSFNRLRQDFYHLPANPELLAERLVKEVIHELGHAYGLYHCDSSGCVMFFSDSILSVDGKGADFCLKCARFFEDKRKGA
jgi:archaemetzincin